VISTLAIAALFGLLRRRIQEFIDQRFYRQKYNSEQALADFAASARNETDLERSQASCDVGRQTMQPEQVSLWLRKGSYEMKPSNFWLRSARLFVLASCCFACWLLLPVFSTTRIMQPTMPMIFSSGNGHQEKWKAFLAGWPSFQWWIQWNLISAIVFATIIGGSVSLSSLRKNNDWFSCMLQPPLFYSARFLDIRHQPCLLLFPAWQPIITSLAVGAWLGLLLIFYAFPNGKFVPRWTRWAGGIVGLSFCNRYHHLWSDTPPSSISSDHNLYSCHRPGQPGISLRESIQCP